MKLRIAHCLETVGSGGVEQRRLLLARELDPEKYEQILICTKTVGGLPEQFEAAGVRIHEVGVFRGILDPAPYRAALSAIRAFAHRAWRGLRGRGPGRGVRHPGPRTGGDRRGNR